MTYDIWYILLCNILLISGIRLDLSIKSMDFLFLSFWASKAKKSIKSYSNLCAYKLTLRRWAIADSQLLKREKARYFMVCMLGTNVKNRINFLFLIRPDNMGRMSNIMRVTRRMSSITDYFYTVKLWTGLKWSPSKVVTKL